MALHEYCVARVVRTRRAALAITQVGGGLSASTVSDIERGESRLTNATRLQLLGKLGLTSDRFDELVRQEVQAAYALGEDELHKQARIEGLEQALTTAPKSASPSSGWYQGNYLEAHDAEVERLIDYLERDCPRLYARRHHGRFIIAAAVVDLMHVAGGVQATVRIPRDPAVATEPGGRCQFERGVPIGSHHPDCRKLMAFLSGEIPGPIQVLARASAGGAILILRCSDGRYVVLGKKDDGNVPHRLHLVAASGMSQALDEINDPELICVDELAEEIQIVKADRSGFVQPKFNVNNTTRADEFNKIVQHTQRWRFDKWRQRLRSTIGEIVPAHARLEHIGPDTIITTWEGGASTRHTGLLVPDPEIGAIDLVGAVEVNVDLPLSELVLLDGEEYPQGKLLNREIFAMSPKAFAMITYDNSRQGAQAVHYQSGQCHGWGFMGVPAADDENGRHRPPMNPPLLKAAAAIVRYLASVGEDVGGPHLGDPVPSELRGGEAVWYGRR